MLISLTVVTIVASFSVSEAGYCHYYYQCSSTAYYAEKYYEKCGFMYWGRCSRYRSKSYVTYKACKNTRCCTGYTGNTCSQPICFGATSCANGGTCKSPNYCTCKQGFASPRCSDVNECLDENGGCSQLCTNELGSFRCSCNNGYILNADGRGCTDIDECLVENGGCQHVCLNKMGSYECLCRNGYTLLGDEKTCVDINECDGSNGDCDQKCVNFPGGHTCDCNQGYKFGDDGNKCIDINECLDGTSKCSHDCVNTVGSYSCSCKPGYTLAEDGFACNDNDDCTGISCLNGGSCIDGLNSYSCKCTSGFDGYHCEQDINECSILNGGCKEVCVNTKGSYYCKCHNDVIIQGTVDTCNENETSSNIFEKHKIPRRLLPRGCSFVEIFSCGSTGQERILMSSTSSWYKLKANSSVLYTFGVVFIEANGIDIPASISGIKVVSTGENINLIVGSIEHTEVDGVETGSKRTENCFSFSITPKDVHDLIGAFLPSVFDGVYSSIPNWLKFSAKGSSVLAITDLKTDLLHGRRVNSLVECRDAPLFDQELYSIFRFGANMVLTVFGDDINLPSPLDGHKFCLIVSMCEDSKGTFHFMVPPESRHFLRKLDFVDNLYSTYGVDIKPIGLGLSLTKKINVHKSVTEIEFWNGLHFSMYLIPKTSNAWFQTNVVWQQLEESYELHLAADIEMFFTVPNLQKLLTGAFVDEWNGLVRIKQIGFTPTLKFTLFGKKVVFDFKDAVVGSIDVYFSFGGHDKRVMCGENANPEGLFLSLLINANPFRDVPYLGEWFLNLDVKFHAFLTTDSNMTSNKVIDIKTVVELIDLKSYLERFRSLTSDIVNKFGSSISLEAVGLIHDVDAATNDSIITLTSVLNTGVISPQEAVSIINNIWEQYVTLFRKKVAKILDAIEYDSSQAARNISQFLRDEQQRIEMSVETVVSSLRQNMFSAVGGYKGFGFKFSSEFTIMGLIFGPMDVELVHSIDSFSKCSKFHKVYSLLGNEESVYFLIRNTLGIRKFGSFQQLKKGQTLSFACSLKRNHFVLSYSVDLHVLSMKVEAGVVLSQGQMTIYAEGSIFNIFYARLTMTASIGRAWYDLRFSVKGELPARNGNGGFGGSYLDGLRQVANNAGQSANKRITELQKGLTVAQNVLTSAQQKLSDAQSAVRKANSVFEDAIRSLDKAKQKLEDAKKPYQKALERLAKAQKNVDRLCQIKYCAPVCIGGFVWRRCSGWIGSYPCLKWSNCAYKIPNLVCHAANAACHVVRALAYAALEASKIFVRAAMIPFDIAKAAVTAVQFVVDKSRVVLLVAEGVLELARIGLETVKIGFEVAKAALESVKLILGAAFHVFNLIVKYGLQNLLDVRNCNFDLELTTVDKTEFDVSCEVKMFGLNWHTFVYEYDFKNPLLSNLRFAKSTVETLLKMIGDLFGKRRKREIAFASMTTVHHILQLQKRGISNKTIYETLKTMNSNESVDYPESSVQFKPKFSDRVSYFMFSCQLVSHINGFLLEAIEKLQSLHNESVTTLERMKNSNLTDRISNTTHDGRWAKSGNSVMELYDIDLEYAQQEFNLTEEEMLIAIESSTDASSNDTLLSSMTNESRIVEDFMKAEEENANKLSLISPWIVGMDNTTNQYFNVSDCSGFSDCVLYSFFVLYEVFSDETIDETKTAKTIISNLEDGFAELLKNQSRSVVDSSLLAQNISDFLSLFNDSNIFCSEPPTAHTKDKTLTLLAGNNVDLVCQVTGNPYPNVLWRLNGVELTGAHNQQLAIKNLQPSNAGNYTCDASNVVTKVTSESIEITVKECSPGTFFNGLDCIACNVGSFQPWKNQLECFACSKGFTTDKTASTSVDDCQDVNECSSADYYKICNHKCVNLNGTFACTCNPGFVLGDDGATCKETSMDAALLSSGVIGSIIGVFIFIFMIYKVCQKKTAKKIQPLEVQQQPIKQCFDSLMLQTQKK